MREIEPKISKRQVRTIKKFLNSMGYPESGYLKIVDEADKDGYATFDLQTGRIVTKDDGYFVSFQVNKEINVRRDYTAEEYDLYVYECVLRTGSIPYLGTYGNAEISFWTSDLSVARKMMYDYNQRSVYDVCSDKVLKNNEYNRETNPTED